MKFKLSISEAAKFELREAFLWYEDQLMNLGEKFQEEIFLGFESIKSNPNNFQIRYKNVRVYFFKKISIRNSLCPIRKLNHNHRYFPYFTKPGKMA